eukprot:187582_1
MGSKRKRQSDDLVMSKSQESCEIGSVVFPGDSIDTTQQTSSNVSNIKKTVIGAGLMQAGQTVMSTRVGVLRRNPHNQRLWVDSHQKRYIPLAEDTVIGVITEVHGLEYKLKIGGPFSAILPCLAFEGATKRNRPELKVGDLVYCRVAVANKHMEPELSCISPHFKKEWMTGEALFTNLVNGYLFECSLKLARDLLSDESHVLNCLGRTVAFEVAIGVNGRVWVKSENERYTIAIVNCILNSEHISNPNQVEFMVKMVMDQIRGK